MLAAAYQYPADTTGMISDAFTDVNSVNSDIFFVAILFPF